MLLLTMLSRLSLDYNFDHIHTGCVYGRRITNLNFDVITSEQLEEKRNKNSIEFL